MNPSEAKWAHLRDTEEKHGLRSVPAPSARVRRLDESLKWVQRLLAGYAQDAHDLREPPAAAAIEVAESAVEDARERLTGRKT